MSYKNFNSDIDYKIFEHIGIPGLQTQVLDAGLWTLDSGRQTLEAGVWTLDSRQRTLNPGRWTLDPERQTADAQIPHGYIPVSDSA